jgi:hypothetical protein
MQLGTLEGKNANLAVLLFFLIFTCWAVSEISLPLYSRFVDENATRLLRDQEGQRSSDLNTPRDGVNMATVRDAPSFRSETEIGNSIRQALEASIRAQEESLKAQKAFLQLLDSQAGQVQPHVGPS